MGPNQKQTVDADESPNNSVYLPCKTKTLVLVAGAAVVSSACRTRLKHVQISKKEENIDFVL